jgi:hypothetical protein
MKLRQKMFPSSIFWTRSFKKSIFHSRKCN